MRVTQPAVLPKAVYFHDHCCNIISVGQMLSALERCHSTGIAHRDIKPENILLDNNFQLRMADFGLSSIMEVRVNSEFVSSMSTNVSLRLLPS